MSNNTIYYELNYVIKKKLYGYNNLKRYIKGRNKRRILYMNMRFELERRIKSHAPNLQSKEMPSSPPTPPL